MSARILKATGLESLSFSVLLTDDREVQELNHRYRGFDQPTDVLAFAMRESQFAQFSGDELGDVVISLETARAQASSRKSIGEWPTANTTEHELQLLVIHGFLHLLGFDHGTRDERRRMWAFTDMLRCATHEVWIKRSAPGKKTKRPGAAKTP